MALVTNMRYAWNDDWEHFLSSLRWKYTWCLERKRRKRPRSSRTVLTPSMCWRCKTKQSIIWMLRYNEEFDFDIDFDKLPQHSLKVGWKIKKRNKNLSSIVLGGGQEGCVLEISSSGNHNDLFGQFRTPQRDRRLVPSRGGRRRLRIGVPGPRIVVLTSGLLFPSNLFALPRCFHLLETAKKEKLSFLYFPYASCQLWCWKAF